MFMDDCSPVQIMGGNADDFQYLQTSEYSQQLGHDISGADNGKEGGHKPLPDDNVTSDWSKIRPWDPREIFPTHDGK